MSNKSFYSEKLPTKPKVEEEPSELEMAIRSTRRYLSSEFQFVDQQLQRLTNAWIVKERELSQLYHYYHDQREPFLPGFIYVTIAGFAGSILAKNSMRG
jgi:hypothetical protein